MDYGATDEEPSGGSDDEFTSFARTALDPSADPDDRIAALREAIKACVEADEGGDYDDAEGPGSKPKPGSLALIFGAGPKPKKK